MVGTPFSEEQPHEPGVPLVIPAEPQVSAGVHDAAFGTDPGAARHSPLIRDDDLGTVRDGRVLFGETTP